MPGPISDSFDPEWGTSAKAEEIRDALSRMHEILNGIIGEPPVYIGTLVNEERQRRTILNVDLTEWEWRILRFACERARESI